MPAMAAAFELKKPSRPRGAWNEKVIYRVKDLANGGPEGPPIFDASGNLYGVTGRSELWQRVAIAAAGGQGRVDGVEPVHVSGGSAAAIRHRAWSSMRAAISTAQPTGYNSCGKCHRVDASAERRVERNAPLDLHEFRRGSTPTAVPVLNAAGDFYGMTQAGGRTI